jgi:hypothetical protein
MTPQVIDQFGVQEIFPSDAALTKLGVSIPVDDRTAPAAKRRILFRAYRYTFQERTILLVRLAKFSSNLPGVAAGVPPFTPEQLANHEENAKWLAALLLEHQAAGDAGADVLVLDLTQNPGGSAGLANAFATLLTDRPVRTAVGALHADTLWVQEFLAAARTAKVAADRATFTARAQAVQDALDAGDFLTPPVPFTGVSLHKDFLGKNVLDPNTNANWTKPVLLLTDELSFSACDMFPAVLRQNGIAESFGERTGGGGGNVELVKTLQSSRAEMRSTRSLVYVAREDGVDLPPRDQDLIENNTRVPEHVYHRSVADLRAGWVDYFTELSKAAVALKR